MGGEGWLEGRGVEVTGGGGWGVKKECRRSGTELRERLRKAR